MLTSPHSFSEMPTNRFVESSFWCFDALFVAQQHPARDVQDTFFVKGEALETLKARVTDLNILL